MYDGMLVEYTNGLRQNYKLLGPRALNLDQLYFKSYPQAQCYYEQDPLHQQPPRHFLINRTEFDQSTFIEQSVAMHDFVLKSFEHGTPACVYRQAELSEDFVNLSHSKLSRYVHDGIFQMVPHKLNRTGWKVIEHYFNNDMAVDRFEFLQMLKIIAPRKVPIDTFTVLRYYRTKVTHKSMYNPLAYIAMFKRLKMEGPIIDLHPDLGAKAVACAALGIKYITPRTEKFDKAIELGLIETTGLDHAYLTPSSKAKMIISDNNMASFEIDEALKIGHQAKRMLAFVPEPRKLEIKGRYYPTNMLKVCNSTAKRLLKKHDFIALW